MADVPEAEDQDAHARAGGDIRLPVAVDLVDRDHASRAGLVINRWWLDANALGAGLFGTFAAWAVAVVDLGKTHPAVALTGVVSIATYANETMAQHPLLSNSLRYAAEVIDPVAAERIFAPPPPPEPAAEAAVEMVAAAMAAYESSADRLELDEELRVLVAEQVRESAMEAAGIDSRAATRLLRRARDRAGRAEAEAVEVVERAEDAVEDAAGAVEDAATRLAPLPSPAAKGRRP